MSPNGPHSIFSMFCSKQTRFSKAQKVPPFTSFGIVGIFKIFIFRFKISVFSVNFSRYTRIWFLRPSFFRHHATFFQFVFIEAPSTFNRNKSFCERIELLWGFDTMRHFPKEKIGFFSKNAFISVGGKSGFRVLSSVKGAP